MVLASASFGPLTAELRRAEANDHDVHALLPKLVARRPLDDADDVGAVLISRLHHETSRPAWRRRGSGGELIAGLIPVATGPMSDDMATALTQRQSRIESLARTLAETAIEHNEPG